MTPARRGLLRRAWGPTNFEVRDILLTFVARMIVVLIFACFIVLLMLLVVIF